MSFANLTATDHLDLLARVRTFVESTISPVGERWVVERYIGYDEIQLSSELGTAEAFRAFDGDPNSEWLTALGQALPSYIGCRFVTAVDIRRLEIEAPDSTAGGLIDATPDAFSLDYSDDGIAWTTLQSFNFGSGNGVRKSFSVTAGSPGARLYWRINITTNNGNADFTSIAELEFQSDETVAFLNHAEEPQLIIRGPGLAASDSIYVGMQVYSLPTSDIFNWRLSAFTGYVAGNSFATQPGGMGTPIGFPLWDQAIEYWLVANGQRLILVAKVETVYMTCYLGKILPYATPGQWPYPVMVSGMLTTDALTRYSDAAIKGPWEAASAKLRLRTAGATWLEPECYPWTTARDLRDTPGGYGVIPIQLTDSDGIYGEPDGLSHVSGFGNAVENTIDIGGTDHLVVHDVFRTGIRDYHAVRLD